MKFNNYILFEVTYFVFDSLREFYSLLVCIQRSLQYITAACFEYLTMFSRFKMLSIVKNEITN